MPCTAIQLYSNSKVLEVPIAFLCLLKDWNCIRWGQKPRQKWSNGHTAVAMTWKLFCISLHNVSTTQKARQIIFATAKSLLIYLPELLQQKINCQHAQRRSHWTLIVGRRITVWLVISSTASDLTKQENMFLFVGTETAESIPFKQQILPLQWVGPIP